jgi:hypothetical protein
VRGMERRQHIGKQDRSRAPDALERCKEAHGAGITSSDRHLLGDPSLSVA